MIVADTNVIAYACVRGPSRALGELAEAALLRDPEWGAPRLWRSEMRNVLALHVRLSGMAPDDARDAWRDAVDLVSPREGDVDFDAVMDLARDSGRSAYDCEFVAYAMQRGARLVTADKAIVKAFPAVAVSLAAFAAGER